MKIKCDVCDGTGEINSHPYREQQVPEMDTKTPKKKFKFPTLPTKLAETFLNFAVPVGVVAFASLLIWGAITIGEKHRAKLAVEQAVEEDKLRALAVQYDDHGKYVRCFVHPRTKSTPVSDHYSKINIHGLDPTPDNLVSLGAPADAKCSYFH